MLYIVYTNILFSLLFSFIKSHLVFILYSHIFFIANSEIVHSLIFYNRRANITFTRAHRYFILYIYRHKIVLMFIIIFVRLKLYILIGSLAFICGILFELIYIVQWFSPCPKKMLILTL